MAFFITSLGTVAVAVGGWLLLRKALQQGYGSYEPSRRILDVVTFVVVFAVLVPVVFYLGIPQRLAGLLEYLARSREESPEAKIAASPTGTVQVQAGQTRYLIRLQGQDSSRKVSRRREGPRLPLAPWREEEAGFRDEHEEFARYTVILKRGQRSEPLRYQAPAWRRGESKDYERRWELRTLDRTAFHSYVNEEQSPTRATARSGQGKEPPEELDVEVLLADTVAEMQATVEFSYFRKQKEVSPRRAMAESTFVPIAPPQANGASAASAKPSAKTGSVGPSPAPTAARAEGKPAAPEPTTPAAEGAKAPASTAAVEAQVQVIPPKPTNFALYFDGKDDTVVIPHGPSLVFGRELTIAGWIYFESVPGGTQLLDKFTSGREDIWLQALGTGSGYRLWLYVFPFCDEPYKDRPLTTSGQIPVRAWTHFAYTWDSQTVKVYLNGRLDGQKLVNREIGSASGPLILGTVSRANMAPPIHGKLDELALYSRALSEQEIKGAMKAKLTGKELGLAAYYTFDEGKEYQLTDHSGNGNDGSLGAYEGRQEDGPAWVAGKEFSPPVVKTAAATPPASFTDVPANHWAWRDIDTLRRKNVVTGYSDGTFNPEGEVTRAAMAALILRAKYGPAYTPSAVARTRFSDVPADHWAAPWIERVAAEGIMVGSEGTFAPEAELLREHAVWVLLRAKYGHDYKPPPAPRTGALVDVPADHPSRDWIYQLLAEGVTLKGGPTRYYPDRALTRDQAANFLAVVFRKELER